MGLGDALAVDVAGGMAGSVTLPGVAQSGMTMPVNCLLDTLCLTVGCPGINPVRGQTVHAFAMLATAEGDSQVFALHPSTRIDIMFDEGAAERIHTARRTGLGFVLNAEIRSIIVCGHYTTGSIGSTQYTFTYSGSLLYR